MIAPSLGLRAVAAGLLAGSLWAAPAQAAGPSAMGRKCTITGTAGSDHLRGTRRNDVLSGGGGNDARDHGDERRVIGA